MLSSLVTTLWILTQRSMFTLLNMYIPSFCSETPVSSSQKSPDCVPGRLQVHMIVKVHYITSFPLCCIAELCLLHLLKISLFRRTNSQFYSHNGIAVRLYKHALAHTESEKHNRPLICTQKKLNAQTLRYLPMIGDHTQPLSQSNISTIQHRA